MSEASVKPEHPIQVVARRTGLTPDVIRAWERRYGAVRPRRCRNRRRLYSDEDVRRLMLLQQAVSAGRRISDVAPLALEELRSLAVADAEALGAVSEMSRDPADEGEHLQACVQAVERLDADGLESALNRAAVRLGLHAFLEDVVAPLMRIVGERWRQGTLRICHEHLATAMVGSLLGTLRSSHTRLFSGPDLVVATPAGEVHEVGALMVAVTAAAEGWRVAYLGADLPAEEIAAAAASRGARAVALSVVRAGGERRLLDELLRIRRVLPQGVDLLVGGRDADRLAADLPAMGAVHVRDLGELSERLRTIRTRSVA